MKSIPCALTIAGSDSGGGAGIQADLKTFAAFGVHGTTAITCITAQNPKWVQRVEAVTPKMVVSQLESIFVELPPRAVKTGMLYSRQIIAAVADYFGTGNHPPLVIDPVMVATSGSRLLKPDAQRVLCNRLIPFATLLTPNLDEARILTGLDIRSVDAMREAARWIQREWGCAVLVKGGHLRGTKDAVDILWDGRTEMLLSAPFVKNVSLHGTGCTYSAAITAGLAQGHSLATAVSAAKNYITRAIAGIRKVARHQVLG